MGSYGIGLGRNVACVVEAHHDEKGIVWPRRSRPTPPTSWRIGANKEPRVTEIAERLHAVAAEAGYWRHILYDDRDESPGVKFTRCPKLLGMGGALVPHGGRRDRLAGRLGGRGHEPGRPGSARQPLVSRRSRR
jgi:prolyl-tRNA synthetase